MKELVFEDLPRELHFIIDDRNVVTWKALPAGESGITVPFPNEKRAEEFATGYAMRMGYKKKLVEENK